ncbi:hypothetical protein [Paractinoplanes durhamensis]|uniref:hypothetical protein n=1 Tax=Paractinoplanes durhamensis TaxID=113563 RepID=UPI003631819D
MLDNSVLVETPFARAAAVHCPGEQARWSAEEQVTGASLVLVRRGVFVRSADGRAAVADVTTGYLQRPGSLSASPTPGVPTSARRSPSPPTWPTVSPTPAPACTSPRPPT